MDSDRCSHGAMGWGLFKGASELHGVDLDGSVTESDRFGCGGGLLFFVD